MPLPHEWRHQTLPSPRTPCFPRPPEERKIIRHKAYALALQSPEEASTELELLDDDFYLFTERATGQDSVLYRTADGYRLAQVRPRPGGLGPVHVAVTVSEHPAPRLTPAAATARLEALGQPFLFFVSSETGRGNLIHHASTVTTAPAMAASWPHCVPPELLATLRVEVEVEVYTVAEGLMSRCEGRVALQIRP